MANFLTYLKQSGQTIGTFARKIGKSPSFLSEIASGKKIPSLKTAKAISVGTGGAISVTHWVDEDGPPYSEEGSSPSHIATENSSATSQEQA